MIIDKPLGQILHFSPQVVHLFEKSECRIGSEQTVVGLRDRNLPAFVSEIMKMRVFGVLSKSTA